MASFCQVEELKERGNVCVREGKFEEAVLHYSHAINLDPKNVTLYSNRSLAFLRMKQYYFAQQDAKETIRLNPGWVKGYFRQGQVQMSTCHFVEALLSYRQALELQPNDSTIIEALSKTARECQKEKKADEQIPWLGAGLGIIIGVVIVICDYSLSQKPTLSHPVLMALLTIAIAMIGYGIARALRYYKKCQSEGLLEPPLDLLKDGTEKGGSASDGEPGYSKNEDSDGVNSASAHNHSHRYTKAQARLRFKKGKS